MAYDPNDPEDKKAVDKLIKAALEAQAEEHESDITGLKNKNKELISDLRKAREGKGKPEDVAALEDQLEETRAALAKTQKDLGKVNTKLEETTGRLNASEGQLNDTLVEQALTENLVSNKVVAEYMPAVKALLKPQVKVIVDDKGRNIVVGDKSVSDYIKEWSQGDQGKIYIGAPANGGAGAKGGSRGSSGNGTKQVLRSTYEAAIASGNHAAAAEMVKGAEVIDG